MSCLWLWRGQKVLEILSGQVSITTQETPAEADRSRAIGKEVRKAFLQRSGRGRRDGELAAPHPAVGSGDSHSFLAKCALWPCPLESLWSQPKSPDFLETPQVGSVMLQ